MIFFKFVLFLGFFAETQYYYNNGGTHLSWCLKGQLTSYNFDFFLFDENMQFLYKCTILFVSNIFKEITRNRFFIIIILIVL